MTPISATRYDRPTRVLHAALAVGVVVQLALSSVMHVPAGRGLGVFDWHRAAFEMHAKVGLALATVCALHWLWVCLPVSRPGFAWLFPWFTRGRRQLLRRELSDLMFLRTPAPESDSPLIGSVHGLGLMVITTSAAGGIVNYLGYFRGVPIPRWVLHEVALVHISMGYLMWVFVTAHVGMALRHGLSGDQAPLGIFRP